MRLVLVGAGGYGREAFDIVRAMEEAGATTWSEFAGYVDDGTIDRAALDRLGVAFLGPTTELVAMGEESAYAIPIGVGAVRRRLDEVLVAAGCVPMTIVHPAASVGSDNRVGAGCILAAGARVTSNITLGRHVDLHVNSTIGHDSVLDDFASVYPGATVSGDVHLGTGVVVGTGANILPGVTIGDGTFVGAGAVVTKDLPAAVVATGVPARVTGPTS